VRELICVGLQRWWFHFLCPWRSPVHRHIGRTLSFTIALASVAVGSFPRDAFAQLSGRYEGVAEKLGSEPGGAPIHLTVIAPGDTMSMGYLAVGAPLGYSGVVYSFPQGGDSIVLVSHAASGDTIDWMSPTRTRSLGGSYSIRGGPNKGQYGRWKLTPIPPPPLFAFALTTTAIGFALVLVAAILWVARRSSTAWWRERVPAPGSPIEESRRQQLTGVGGWLALFVVGNSLVVLYMTATSGEIFENVSGTTWLLGDVISGMHPVLWIEAAAHAFQVVGTAVGLVLILKRSSMTPVYWLCYLALMACYAVVDIGAGAGAIQRTTQMLGKTYGDAFAGGADNAEKKNMQVLLRSALWGLYFFRSQRVRLTFQPRVKLTSGSFPTEHTS
jgi:hypothetical protein